MHSISGDQKIMDRDPAVARRQRGRLLWIALIVLGTFATVPAQSQSRGDRACVTCGVLDECCRRNSCPATALPKPTKGESPSELTFGPDEFGIQMMK